MSGHDQLEIMSVPDSFFVRSVSSLSGDELLEDIDLNLLLESRGGELTLPGGS